jgi:hypothetical protein
MVHFLSFHPTDLSSSIFSAFVLSRSLFIQKLLAIPSLHIPYFSIFFLLDTHFLIFSLLLPSFLRFFPLLVTVNIFTTLLFPMLIPYGVESLKKTNKTNMFSLLREHNCGGLELYTLVLLQMKAEVYVFHNGSYNLRRS